LIRFEEHTYFDDPLKGHPDVRTRLKNAEYFFLGNGLINGAIQYSPSGEGSLFGFLIMHPETLSMKRNSLTMDDAEGLSATSLIITENNLSGRFDNEGTIGCKNNSGLPVIEVLWHWSNIKITELFYCPDRINSHIIREIQIENLLPDTRNIDTSTAVPGDKLNYGVVLQSMEKKKFHILYSFGKENCIKLELLDKANSDDAIIFWKNKAIIKSDHISIDKFFYGSAIQLASMVSANGKMDASIWQYNREWVRDHSFMCLGLIYTGHGEQARIFLERLLNEFVSDEGDTIDSSEKRDYDEVELDQNGVLLYAINEYMNWTGDSDFILKNKEKITSIAEFPLRSEFHDNESDLLHNSREYWERHSIHGITDGFEFACQLWVIKGLKAAALAGREFNFGFPGKWETAAKKLSDNLLDEDRSGLVSDGKFIKRRKRDGSIAKTIKPQSSDELPQGIPLAGPGDHYLDPDSSVSQAIVYDIADPESDLALNTMKTIDELWNQGWNVGGYGRYNITSEPDSPGPWPFPSLFIARAYLKMGRYEMVERVLDWLNKIPGGNSCSWFENYGERISPPYPQVGIPPWTWAEVIMLVIKDMLGVSPGKDYVRIKPLLLPSINRFDAIIPVRGMIIDLKITRSRKAGNQKEVLIPIVKGNVIVSMEI